MQPQATTSTSSAQADPAKPHAAESFPPAGFVDVTGAAAFFGISSTQVYDWIKKGRLTCPGEMVNGPNGKRGRIWPIAELERAKEAMANPDGWVPGEAARAVFGVSLNTWNHWVQDKRVPQGRWGHGPTTGKRCLLFPLDELKRLKAQWDEEEARSRQALEPYRDPDRPGVYRLPVSSDKHKGMEALIDADAVPLVHGERWNFSPGSYGRGMKAAAVVLSGKNTPLARIVMGVVDEPQRLVSHVNGDKLDCRRENLIVRTRSEVKLASKRPAKWDRVGEAYPDPDRPGVLRVPVCSDMHEAMEALIDSGDLPLVQGKRWNWSPGSNGRGMRTGSVVLRMNGTPKPTLARILLGIEDPEQLVAHRNGDRLDCRRANLVVRNRQQVKAASRKAPVKGGRACSSRFKGVHWQPDGRKWSATIFSGGKTRQLGRFISEIDAAVAYDAAARELYGEHALMNFADPAEAQRLRAEQPAAEPGTFPPPGMVDVDGACQMFNFPKVTWTAWMQQGRMPLDGGRASAPDGEVCTLYRVEDLNRLKDEIRQLVKPYPDPDQSGCYRVPLISHLLYREAIIDEQSLPLLEGRGWHWQGRCDGSELGQVVTTVGRGMFQPMARVVAGVAEAGFDVRVSHRNGDPLDCRLSNLVVRSMQEQTFGNRKMGTVNGRQYTSKFKGVSWNKRDEKWVANIQRDRRIRRLGSFHSEIAAAQAYDEAARELFGEHARLNFPDGIDAYLEREACEAQQQSEIEQREAA